MKHLTQSTLICNINPSVEVGYYEVDQQPLLWINDKVTKTIVQLPLNLSDLLQLQFILQELLRSKISQLQDKEIIVETNSKWYEYD